MPVSFTQKGYYEVWRDGQKISQHNREREATETITEHSAIHGDGDYEIRPPLVMAKAYGVVSNQDGGDTTPPTTPGSVSASATSATTGTVTWTASTDNVGVAGYQVFVDGSPVDTTTSLSYGLTGLSPSTQYSVTVTAYDAAGNNSPAGGPSLFTTDANSAPVWSLGNQSYTTGDAVSIDLDANCTDADGDTITYSLVSGTLPSGLALSGVRNQTLSGSVDTVETANFTLGASDGIASVQTVALTFTITAPDTTAPSAPTNLSITTVTGDSISLNWDDNAESDLASYSVYRSTDGVNFGLRATISGSPPISLYVDGGLNASTTYYYYVTAIDNSDNESSASSTVSDTTLSVNTPYDLSGFTFPFVHSWPTSPSLSGSTATVSPGNTSALSTSGLTITFQSGDYGGVTMSSTDQKWIIQSGANLQGVSVSSTAARIRIEGETARVGDLGTISMSESCQDILFYEIYAEMTAPGGHKALGSRIGFVYCWIRAADYGFFSGADNPPYLNDDITIAKCLIQTTSTSIPHLTRWYNAEHLVIVDSRVQDLIGTSSHVGFRFHSDGAAYQAGNTTTDGVYIGSNEFIYAGGSFGHYLKPGTSGDFPGAAVTNFVFENNDTYIPGGGDDSPVQWDSTNIYESHTFRNNVFYGGRAIPTPPDPTWTVTGNSSVAYQAPPAWSFV